MTDEQSVEVEIENISDAKKFILAGNAIFTIVGKDNRFTYKVMLTKSHSKYVQRFYKVFVLNGSNNETDYVQIGIINPVTNLFSYNTYSKFITPKSLSLIAFAYFYEGLVRNAVDKRIRFYHVGKCGRCGRRLTTPESIQAGIGEICASKMD